MTWKYTKINIIFHFTVSFVSFRKIKFYFMVYFCLYFVLHIYGAPKSFKCLGPLKVLIRPCCYYWVKYEKNNTIWYIYIYIYIFIKTLKTKSWSQSQLFQMSGVGYLKWVDSELENFWTDSATLVLEIIMLQTNWKKTKNTLVF